MKRLGVFALLGILGALAYVALMPPPEEEKPGGVALPPMQVKILKGSPYQPGKPLLLEFWATWCGPCRENIPHLNEIQKKYGPRGLQVIGVSSEESQAIKHFINSVPMHYTVAEDATGKLGDYFQVNAIPYAVLVDGSGKVRWTGHPEELKSDSIESVL